MYWQSHWLSITVFQSGALRYRSSIPLADTLRALGRYPLR
ncbi:hypothetical protein HMPREF0693_2129 [Proteus mirabilis ATCC 29906]|nr:hypothetical protein HMPREF0693_2129 [Proteus mirabilis ATCC 29906]